MALSKKDIQILKEIVNDSEKKLTVNIDVLKVYMDTKFKETSEEIKNTRNEILQEIDAVLQNHENRIVKLEHNVFVPS